jgi:hypothetical protein
MKRKNSTARKRGQTTQATGTTATPKGTGTTGRAEWDKNGDGRIDIDDLLIGLRDCFAWVFSWRGMMLVWVGFTCLSALVNVASWSNVLQGLKSAAPGVGFLCWAAFQAMEIHPMLDDLNLQSSLSALVRLQRKPMEIPVVNTELNPEAETKMRAYKRRGKNRDRANEFIRFVAYGIELAVLVGGGGIFTSTGMDWASVLLAIVGMVGVEIGLRKANECGENLLEADERAFLQSILSSKKMVAETVPGETAAAA